MVATGGDLQAIHCTNYSTHVLRGPQLCVEMHTCLLHLLVVQQHMENFHHPVQVQSDQRPLIPTAVVDLWPLTFDRYSTEGVQDRYWALPRTVFSLTVY